MPNCEQLIIDIQETIRENGNNEITGPILQDVLIDMVHALCGEQQSFDELTMWSLLSKATPEQINVSHLSATDVAGMLTQAGYKLTDTTYGLATDAVAGLLKTGYAASGRNYAVELDEDGRAFVNVPWTDKFDTYFGVDEDGNIYVKGNRGFWSNSFISARGSDPEAGVGGSGGGLDVQAMWYALGQPTNEKINVSHIPAIGMDKVSGLADALAAYALKDGSNASGTWGISISGTAGEVENALTINNDGGSSSASAKTYNGSASVTINIPTTLPASDVYDWAKQPDKPSYNFSEIGSKPTTLAGYGIKDGVNSAEAGGHLTASVSGHKLSVGVASGYAIPSGTQISLWDKIAALFAIDADGNVYVTGNRGFYGNSFISARGSDPGAGSGGGSGVDMESVWYALGQPTTEKINVSHIPALQQLSGTLTNAQLANSAISVAGVSVSLGGAVSTEQIASALGLGSNAYTSTAYLPLAGGTMTGALSVNSYIYSPKGLFGLTEEQADSYAGKAYYNLAVGQKSPSMGASLLLYRDSTSYQSCIVWSTETQTHIVIGLAADANDLIIENHKAGIQIKGTGNLTYNTYPLLHSGNYTNYTVTKTGGGASGTWPISVSGTAADASKLGGIYSAEYMSHFRQSGVNIDTYATRSPKIIEVSEAAGTKPLSSLWLQVMQWGSNDPAYGFQMANRYTEHGSVFFRQKVGGTWGGWKTLLDSSNYATLIDSRYVKKSGDTMTGTLTFPTATNAYDSLAVRFSGVSTRIGVDAAGGLGLYAQDAMYLRPSWTYGGTSYGLIIRASDLTYNGHPIWHAGNDGSGSGLDADLLDGTHKSGLLTALTSNTSTNLSLTVGGTVKTVAALYATYLGGQTLGGTRRGMTFLSSSFSAAGWYRVYTSSSGNSSSESEVLLHIGRNYYSPQNEHYSFSICVGYNGDISITQLSGVMGGHLITKIRVVWANSQKFYIDIYSAASSYNNTYGVTGQGYGTFSAFTSGASIPDGYAAYEFTTVDGCKSSGGFSTTGVEGRAIGFDGNSINLCAATGGWAMGIKTYHHDRATSFDHWVCGAYGDNGDNISYTYYGGTYASPAMVILPNKRVGIGTTAPTDRLHVIGTIRATTGIWSNGYVSAKGQDTTSDARYKRDVAALPAQAALSVLMRLRPSTWAWKDDGRRGAGFVAQEVLGVLPEAVREVGGGEDRHLALNYQMLHAYEVSMLQTHEERLTKLENEIKRIRHGS